jgi:hypothetical protein
LDIALANNTKVPDRFEGRASKHMVFIIRQSLRWGDDDRITGMRAKRVEVLHVAANDRVLKINISAIKK